MADFDFCINEAVKAGKISKDIAEQMIAADDKDGQLNLLVDNLTRQKRESAIQAVRLSQAFDNIKSHPDGGHAGLVSLLSKDPKGKANYFNVDYTQKVKQGQYHARFAEAFSRFRTRNLGFSQDEEGLRKLVRAIYGETVDDGEIMQFAQDFGELTEFMRKDFNKLGGSIAKNERWLLPQNHDHKLVSGRAKGLTPEAARAEWKNFIMPRLDRTQMLDDLGRQLDDDQLSEALDVVFETITTGGMNKTKDFAVPRLGTKLSRKGSEKRFLFFKDSDSWLDYQDKYGKGDVFTTITDHIETRAHDAALMQIMGTNPEQTFKALQNQIDKTEGLTDINKSFQDAMFNVVSGKISDGNLTTVADMAQGARNLVTASTLGSAILSAVSDVGFLGITARYNGMSAVKVMQRQMSLLNPANEADRIVAVKLGLTADAWLNAVNTGNRYADVYGVGATTKAAEAVMRFSGLVPWTDAGRKAFGMEMSSLLADNFGKSFDQIDGNLKRAFDNYGINADDWDGFRATKTIDHKGARFADLSTPEGIKFSVMTMTETDFAVPTPDARTRAITTGGMGRNTVAGQGLRSIMMLKSFPITIASTHFYRAAMQANTADKLAYAGALLATTTVMGGISLQLKDIAVGREPRPIGLDDPEIASKFFAAALQQGGGLGIFGDFLFSDVNRFGGGMTQTIIGPMGELVDTGVKFSLGNMREAVLGEETNVLGESAQILKRWTPDTWQTRLLTDAMFDQLELMSNPDAPRRFNRIMRKRQAEFDQGYWWRPGEALPEPLK